MMKHISDVLPPRYQSHRLSIPSDLGKRSMMRLTVDGKKSVARSWRLWDFLAYLVVVLLNLFVAAVLVATAGRIITG
jgi:hypothetical protein